MTEQDVIDEIEAARQEGPTSRLTSILAVAYHRFPDVFADYQRRYVSGPAVPPMTAGPGPNHEESK